MIYGIPGRVPFWGPKSPNSSGPLIRAIVALPLPSAAMAPFMWGLVMAGSMPLVCNPFLRDDSLLLHGCPTDSHGVHCSLYHARRPVATSMAARRRSPLHERHVRTIFSKQAAGR